jgi:hypothetical protein
MDATGCSYDTALYWVESGRLGNCEVHEQQNGTMRYHIDKERVQKAIHISRSSSSTKEMALAVGITRGAMRALVKARVFQTIPFGRARYNIRLYPAEVFAYTAQLLSCARLRRGIDGEQLIFSSAVLRLCQRRNGTLQRFLSALLDGEIETSKVQRAVSQLDELMIDLGSLQRWEQRTIQ